MLFLLDTDTLSLLQRGEPIVRRRIATAPPGEIAVALVTVEEQFQGRLAVIRQSRTPEQIARSYERLAETLQFFCAVATLPFNSVAAERFAALRQQGVRIGTRDLRIAATALVHDATVVTRNLRDFSLVPGLSLEDWSE
jgi:tRNA(fMet)-specific endonuclease VapC